MDVVIGYGGVALFFALIVVVMERTRKRNATFAEFATAGRSFGSFFGTMAFVNTWLPGTIFISFAGLTASSGVLGFYSVSYGLLAVVLMFLLAKPVHEWGRRFDLRTQADLIGLRYNSKAVRLVAAVIGIVASFPWIMLGMQSLGLVFSSLSFGAVGPYAAVIVGVLVIAFRQVWTVRFGMRGVMISDMVQGITAYFVGTALILGLLVWLVTNGHGFGAVDPTMYGMPGPGSPLGPLYAFSLILTGALGGWCWPDIFVRLFTARSTTVIQRSATQAAPILFVFGISLNLLALLASSYPGVSDAPDAVWFTTASIGGVFAVTLAGICVLAATMGNVGANLQALGAQTANDIVGPAVGRRVEDPRIGKVAVAVITVLAAGCAMLTATSTSGLVMFAIISYQGVVQLAPTLLLGIFWRRGTAAGAVASMVAGFVTAAVLQSVYAVSIPWLWGLTSGVAALVVNVAVYVACALLAPMPAEERRRVDGLFDELRHPARSASAAARLQH